MTSSKSDTKKLYEELREKLSNLSRTIKNLETRASKPNFSTDELAYHIRKVPSAKTYKSDQREENDDLGVGNIQDAQTKLERALETLRELKKQQNGRESKIQGAAVGRRRKSKRCFQFEKIDGDVTNYMTLTGDILTEVEQANQVKGFGKSSLQEGKIPRNKEEKTRQELEAFSSRWNGLGEEVLKTANSIETFVSEVETEYSKLKLWISNSEIADSWLMEYEPYADKPEKLGTTIRLVRTQLHENQTVLENFRKSKPRLRHMYDTAVELMKSGRVDEADVDELERVINVLVAKWESIDNRLNASRDRIYAEIEKLRKRKAKQRPSIVRRFSSRRNLSFRRNRSLRKKREGEQDKEVAPKGAQSYKVYVDEQDNLPTPEVVTSTSSMNVNASMDPVHILMMKNRQPVEEKLRLQNQRKAFQTFALTLEACEKTIEDLHSKSLEKFSNIDSNAEEIQKQLDDMSRLETDLKNSKSEFQSEIERLEKAKGEGLFSDKDQAILEEMVKNLQSRWRKLWEEHIANKNRLEKQRDAFKTFDLSLKKKENTINDLATEALQKFSAAGSNRHELEKQLDEIMQFESDLRNKRFEFQSEVDKFEKAKTEGLFTDTDRKILEKRVEDLQNRWDELWKEHISNKNSIVKATLEHAHNSMKNITEDFDKIEKQMNTPEVYDDDDRLSLKENVLKQKRLMEDLDQHDDPINKVSHIADKLLERNLVDDQTCTFIKRKTVALIERQQQLKNSCKESGDRFEMELQLYDQQRSGSPSEVEEETVQISDDYAMLSQSLDDILADEGFAEMDSSKSFLDVKTINFDREVQLMNQWMTDSQKLVNSLHVEMDPKEVTGTVQEIKARYEEIEKKEAKMKAINKLGQEITKESLNMTTTETVEKKLDALNIRWHDTREMLKDFCKKGDEDAAAYQGCCCSRAITKIFHACFYS
ncbi:hypothetical protein ABFA07_015914 [Porites harrisoni]